MILVAQVRGWDRVWTTTNVSFSIPYTSVSVPLNVLLAFMIDNQLVLHEHSCSHGVGPYTINGLYRAISTIFTESSALYAVNSLLVGMWTADNRATNSFCPPSP